MTGIEALAVSSLIGLLWLVCFTIVYVLIKQEIGQ
jgi:hypothetical protein